MFFVIFPLIVMILSTATLFLMKEANTTVYSIVIVINFLMIFLMIKGYLTYLKVTKELRDKDFAQEMTMMVKKLHQNRDKFSRDELVLELEHINRMINEYNLLRKTIVVDPVDPHEFLKHSDKNH